MVTYLPQCTTLFTFCASSVGFCLQVLRASQCMRGFFIRKNRRCSVFELRSAARGPPELGRSQNATDCRHPLFWLVVTDAFHCSFQERCSEWPWERQLRSSHRVCRRGDASSLCAFRCACACGELHVGALVRMESFMCVAGVFECTICQLCTALNE